MRAAALMAGGLAVLLLGACGFSPAQPNSTLPAVIPPQWQQPTSTLMASAAQVDDGSALIDSFADHELSALWWHTDRNNYSLQQTRAQLAVAAAQAGIDSAALWPQLSAGLASERHGGEIADEANLHQAVVSTRWEIDLWGKLAANRRASEFSLEAAVADLEAARLSQAAALGKRWFDAIQAREANTLARANRDAVENITRIVRSSFQRGIATLLDVRIAESNLALARNDEATAAQTLVTAQQLLAQIVGAGDVAQQDQPPTTIMPSDTASLPTVPPSLPSRLPAQVIRQRPDIVAAERRYRAAAETWQNARLARLPSFTLNGDAAQGGGEFSGMFSDGVYSWNIAAQLLAPVFDGGALKSRQQQAEALRIRQLYGYGEVVFNAVLEINSRIEQYRLWQQRLIAAQNLQQATNTAEQLALRDYRSGLTDLSVLLTARRDTISAERTLLSTRFNMLNNHIELLLALGGVSAVNTAAENSAETASP